MGAFISGCFVKFVCKNATPVAFDLQPEQNGLCLVHVLSVSTFSETGPCRGVYLHCLARARCLFYLHFYGDQ